jgi:hypothetical protein
MVLGIGDGNIEIIIDRQNYVVGNPIKGEVQLKLNTKKEARELRLLFYGEITERRHDTVGSRHRTHTHTRRIYEQKVILDGKKAYAAGTQNYPFEITIPNIPAPASSSDGGIVGTIVNVLTSGADPVKNAKFYLDVSLDVPMSLDINKKIRIYLSR